MAIGHVALLDHRRRLLGERAAGLARRRPRAGARPQRQPDQRGRALGRAEARRGIDFRGTSDSEIIAALLSSHDGKLIEDAVGEVMPRLEGAYSTVVMTKHAIVAFRDPHGIRPLSPRPARRPLRRRLGELRLRHHRRRADARGAPRRDGLADRARAWRRARWSRPSGPAICVFEHIYFSRPDSRLEGKVLQQVRGRMGEILWREAPVEADLVISVPDSGNPAAAGFARASGLPRDDGLIKNRYVARTFIQPGPGAAQARPAAQVQPAAGDRRRPADRRRRRLDRARQHDPADRRHAARRRRPRGAPADLGAADPQPLPLRRRHVDPRGDDRPRAHGRGDRRRARRRLASPTSRWRASTRRSAAARGPLRRLLQRPLPARRPGGGERQVRPRGHRRSPSEPLAPIELHQIPIAQIGNLMQFGVPGGLQDAA